MKRRKKYYFIICILTVKHIKCQINNKFYPSAASWELTEQKPAWIIIYVTSVNDTIKNAGWVYSVIRQYTLRSIHIHSIPFPFSTTRGFTIAQRMINRSCWIVLYRKRIRCSHVLLLAVAAAATSVVQIAMNTGKSFTTISLSLLIRIYSWIMKQTRPSAVIGSRKNVWTPFVLWTKLIMIKYGIILKKI